MFNNSSQFRLCNETICRDMTKNDYDVYYINYNFVTIIVLLPLISVFGLFSNIFNVFIYSRPELRGSSSILLAALGFSDFFVVVTGVFMFWVDSARTYLNFLKYSPYVVLRVLPFGYMVQTCSVYFTVFAAVDCYVKVCWTPFARYWCTVVRAKQTIVAIVIGSVAYNSLRFGQLFVDVCLPANGTRPQVMFCITDLYIQINTVYNVYMYMILMTFLPFILLSVLNAFIVQGAKNARGSPTQPKVEPSVVSESESSVSSADTITMVMVVVLFLLCNTLSLVINIVETFFGMYLGENAEVIVNYMSDTSNLLVVFNSSVNFVIYMVFSEEFRNVFWAEMGRRQRRATPQMPHNGYILANVQEIRRASLPRWDEGVRPSVPAWDGSPLHTTRTGLSGISYEFDRPLSPFWANSPLLDSKDPAVSQNAIIWKPKDGHTPRARSNRKVETKLLARLEKQGGHDLRFIDSDFSDSDHTRVNHLTLL